MCFAGKNVVDRAQKPSVAPENQKNQNFQKMNFFTLWIISRVIMIVSSKLLLILEEEKILDRKVWLFVRH
jgi:hypothetical protein